MKVFITGISGFVGKYLCKVLLEQGNEVAGISRKAVFDIENKINYWSCDINDYDRLKKILSDYRPDEIYHLSGPAFIPDSYKKPLIAYDTVVRGTLNLYEVVRELKLNTKILFVGSADCYGRTKDLNIPINEETLLHPENPYAGSKACADLISTQYVQTYGLNIIRVRPFNHTGPGQSSDFVCSSFSKQIAKMEKSESRVLKVGNTNVKRDFLDVRDVVDAYYLLMKKGIIGEVYNVCSGKTLSIKQIIDWLFMSSRMSESYSIKVDSQKVRSNDVLIRIGDNSKLIGQLKWKPKRELRITLEEMLNYWRDRV